MYLSTDCPLKVVVAIAFGLLPGLATATFISARTLAGVNGSDVFRDLEESSSAAAVDARSTAFRSTNRRGEISEDRANASAEALLASGTLKVEATVLAENRDIQRSAAGASAEFTERVRFLGAEAGFVISGGARLDGSLTHFRPFSNDTFEDSQMRTAIVLDEVRSSGTQRRFSRTVTHNTRREGNLVFEGDLVPQLNFSVALQDPDPVVDITFRLSAGSSTGFGFGSALFGNTGSFILDPLPAGVSLMSESGIFLTATPQPPEPGAAVPAPGTLVLALVGLLLLPLSSNLRKGSTRPLPQIPGVDPSQLGLGIAEPLN